MASTHTTSCAGVSYQSLDRAPYGPPLPTRRHDDYRLQVFALAALFVVSVVFTLWREVAPFVS